MPTPRPMRSLLDRIGLGCGILGEDLSSVGGMVLSGCEMVRMRVAGIEGVVEVEVEGVVAEDMDAGDVEEHEVLNVPRPEGTKEAKEAISCSGDGASKVSSVGFEQSIPPEP